MPVELVYEGSSNPLVSVVVPTLDGSRGGNVHNLVEQLKAQTFKSIEVIASVGETPNGYARNLGARKARGLFLVFIDDDVRLGKSDLLTRLIDPLRKRDDVGLTGVSQNIPPEANRFQRWTSGQIQRATSPIVNELTDSDMVTTMCLAIPKNLFERIGMMDSGLRAGVDPDLRNRVRIAGYRVVVVPNAWALHPLPDSLIALVRYGFKKGGLSAWQHRCARHLSFDCPDGHSTKAIQTTLCFRVIRKSVRILREIFQFRFLGLIYDVAYTVGYVRGLTRAWS